MAYTTIDDPSAYFQTATYTGAGANTAVTNGGNSDLKPDFLWIKNRTAGYAHFVVDSNRNISYAQNSSNAPYLETDSTAAENNNQNWMQSVNTDGFTTGISEHTNSNSGSAYVAWQWKANGGTTSSNTAGNITSTVQVNSTAGFSIVTWTGNENSSATVGHGLGVKPDMVFFKRRNATYNWVVYCGQLGIVGGNNMFAYLNLSNAAEQGAGITFTSSLLGPGNGAPTNSGLMIAYCFAEKQGFSKFGKYIGNSLTNGAFVYTGFKPAFIMLKQSSNSGNGWFIIDSARDPDNKTTSQYLRGDESGSEGSSKILDLLSNGFKLKNDDSGVNGAYHTYIYMAFAENPFVTSTGTPTPAG
jgi:hypothetical protein